MKKSQRITTFALILSLIIGACSFAEEAPAAQPAIEEIVLNEEAPQEPECEESTSTNDAISDDFFSNELPQDTQPSQENEAVLDAQESTPTASPQEAEKDAPKDTVTIDSNDSDTAEENKLEKDETPPEEAVEAPSEDMSITISIKWERLTENESLSIGDSMKLLATIESNVDISYLQWQVATKTTTQLQDNEPEWVDIPGANSLEHSFEVSADMPSWRWRLLVGLPADDVVHSEEVLLPELSVGEENQDAHPDIPTPEITPLPIADITLTSETPLDEIAYGSEVSLVAEILHPQEGMLLQWQYQALTRDALLAVETGWIDIPDANDTTLSYVVNEENENWIWRLLISMPTNIEQGTKEEMEFEMDEGQEPDIAENKETALVEDTMNNIGEPEMEEGVHELPSLPGDENEIVAVDGENDMEEEKIGDTPAL